MADPLSSIGARAGIGGAGDIASRLTELREAMQGRAEQGTGGVGGAGGTQGGDAPKRYQVDIGKSDGTSFGDTLTRLINEASAAQDNASDAVQRFVRGEPVELHQVMAATEEAGI